VLAIAVQESGICGEEPTRGAKGDEDIAVIVLTRQTNNPGRHEIDRVDGIPLLKEDRARWIPARTTHHPILRP
jgi:hypothetical protein